MVKWNWKKKRPSLSIDDFAALIKRCGESADFVTFQLHNESPFSVAYYQTIVNSEVLQLSILDVLKKKEWAYLEEIKESLPIQNIVLTNTLADIEEKLMGGHVLIYKQGAAPDCLLIPALKVPARQISIPEGEYTVLGPKESFVESLDTNIALIRKRLPTPDFQTKELTVGNITKTRVAVAYIKGVTSEENVNTVIQRISAINYDQIIDSSFIYQMIADQPNSPFPQLIDTERPDRATSGLVEGKVTILVDGSPSVLAGPITLVEFFSAFEDYFTIWQVSSAIRLLRIFAIMFSVLATPLYVAVLTYHYEVLPQDVLSTLISTRASIPVPPIFEALLMEMTIELLREAGARLPTKVGQTIGIVGGIVIGTAAVQAGVTSNVLLIIVALSALASFITPIYQVSNAVRLVRFPFLLLAQLLGLLGIVVGLAVLLAHLLKIQSLGRPFLAPVYPLRAQDLSDAIIRLPFSKQTTRPMEMRAKKPLKFKKSAPPPDRRDIDE